MKLNTYIAVVPIVEGKLDLLKLTEHSYILVPLWDDLRCLHGKCLFGQFKIFVDQEAPTSSPPRLFVCTLIQAQTVEQAYESGAKEIGSLAADLVTLCSRGFEPVFGQMLVAEFYPPDCPPAIKDKVGLELVELAIEKGNLKTISTPYYCFESRWPKDMHFSHNDYVTAYSRLEKLDRPGAVRFPDVALLPKELLENIESRLNKIMGSRSTDEAQVMTMIAPVYSAAITATNVVVSYLLLWQVLESVASTADFGKNLLPKKAMNGIRALLQQEGYDNRVISRLGSILGGLKQKNDVEVIVEILRHYLRPAQGVDELRQKIEQLRKTRGAIVHVRVPRKLRELEIMDQYGELRHIVDSLVRVISRKACGL